MSFLVEMPREIYPDDALSSFGVAPGFNLDTARAMMWMAQLAYETADASKIENILGAWPLRKVEIVDNPPDTSLPLRTSCAVVAAGRGATIVAFAGTDPLKINDYITDFTALPTAAGIHQGFQDGVARIWAKIRPAIAEGTRTDRALFFTGHSLGGAL